MRFISLLRVETGRLLRARQTCAAIILTAISPLAGLYIYMPIAYHSVNGEAIGNPALAGALYGAIIFAILTARSLYNNHRFRTDVITDSIHSPIRMCIAQMLALLFASILAQIATLIAWLPYAAMQLGSIFSLPLYLSLYICIMLPAICFSVIFTACAYQFTRRFDLSLALFATFILLSLFIWHENWLLRWVNPALAYVSDVFGNTRKFMSISYNRLFWALVLSGSWVFSTLCAKRYGRGMLGAALCNLRKAAHIPVIAVALALSGWFVYTSQPFLDNSPELINYDGIGYEVDDGSSSGIICENIYTNAMPDLAKGKLYATSVYRLHNIAGKRENESLSILFGINPGYRIITVMVNGRPFAFRDLADDNMNEKTIEVDLPLDMDVELTLIYGGFPTEWNIAAMFQGAPEISRDYIYLENASFSPVPKNLITNESFTYTADIELPKGMVPVLFGAGGVKIMSAGDGAAKAEEIVGASVGATNTDKWRLVNDSTSIILYAGDYISENICAAGIDATAIDVELYISRKHLGAMSSFIEDADSVIKNVFEYCTQYIGPLSFMEAGSNSLKLIEIGSFGGGYAGMGASVMGEDSFSARSLSDGLKGAKGDEVLAHEIIHQWWGLGNMFDYNGEDNIWSPEGLTVYTTYRLMKELYGEEYATRYYVDVWRREVDNYYDNYYVRHPEYFDALPKKYQANIMNSFTSMRQYCEMPLMILNAEQLVGGEEAFDKILFDMFNREINEDYSNYLLSYEIFLEYCGLTEDDLQPVAE